MRFSLFCFVTVLSLDSFSQNTKDTLYITADMLTWIEKNNVSYSSCNSDTVILIKAQYNFKAPLGYKARVAIEYRNALHNLSPIVVLNDKKRVKVYHSNGECILGPYKEYYPNGTLKMEGNYDWEVYKRKLGVWKFYDEQSRLMKEVIYDEKGKKIDTKKY